MSFGTGFCNHEIEQDQWTPTRGRQGDWWDRDKEFRKSLAERWVYPKVQISHVDPDEESIEYRFARLAEEWSHNVGHVSSASDMINDPRYQDIISLGWPVVPLLLTDLESNK